jgi:monoamine oxidase
MLREAQGACDESAATGIPIAEMTGMRAELRARSRAELGEAFEIYNDSLARARDRSAPEDGLAKWQAMENLKAASSGLSRRDFLKGAGAAAAGAALAGAAVLRPSAARAGGQPRIVIVGGGLAGIRCAHKLWRKFGWTSTIYEANSSVGGRLQTLRSYFANGQIAEMHGEFISSEHASTLALATLFNLSLDDTSVTPSGTQDTFWFNGSRYTQAQLASDWQKTYWAAFNNAVKTVPWPQTYNKHSATGVTWDTMSIPQWMNANLPGGTTSRFGGLCLEDVIAEYGGDPADQSALNLTMLLGYDDSAGGRGFQPTNYPVLAGTDERWHIKGGNDQLITGMVAQLPAGTIQTGQVLTAVKNNGNGTFTCTFQSGATSYQVICDRLVFALPFKTLRNVDLSKAGLSSLKMTAINNLGMGTNGKIIMQFNGRPWVTDGYNGGTQADNGAESAWELNYQTNNYSAPTSLMLDFPGGTNTLNILSKYGLTQHEGVPPSSLVTATLAELEPIFPGVTAAYSGLAWYHFGNNDPFVQGAWSYWRVGQYTQFSGYGGVAEGNAHFCGEHTAQNFQGFMEGAVTSGERVASEI